ncbi:unannotated protein [freshwater metagenome]|uniref:Unannotated protein n=1 Tax=freshwater metagenome TaxID=449393 RepID=A0A6J7URK2_9ZZZZ
MARRAGAALTDDVLDLASHCFQRDAEGLQGFCGNTLALMNEAKKDVLRPDVRVVEQTRFLLRQHHNPPGSISESFEHKTECIGGVSRLLSGINLRVFGGIREYSGNFYAGSRLRKGRWSYES